MALTSTFFFYEDIFSNLNSALSSYVSEVATAIIGAITPVATTLLMIYMMMWGWSMIRGVISEPITDGLGRMVRLTVIVALALNIGRYNGYISDFLWNSPDAMAGYIASGYSDSASNMHFLDSLMAKIYDMGDAYWQKGTAPIVIDLGEIIIALLIWAAGILSTAYAAFLLALSKIALAIILGIGPLFVLMLIFEPTKRFFDVWIGQALNYLFLTMLTAANIKLMMSIIKVYLVTSAANGALADPSINQALPAIALCIMSTLVMMQLPSMAAALGGGVAISTLGAVGWAYRKAKGGADSARDFVSGKTLSDMRGARRAQATNARWASNNPGTASKAASAPMAVYRKITGAGKNKVSNGS